MVQIYKKLAEIGRFFIKGKRKKCFFQDFYGYLAEKSLYLQKELNQ